MRTPRTPKFTAGVSSIRDAAALRPPVTATGVPAPAAPPAPMNWQAAHSGGGNVGLPGGEAFRSIFNSPASVSPDAAELGAGGTMHHLLSSLTPNPNALLFNSALRDKFSADRLSSLSGLLKGLRGRILGSPTSIY